MKKQLLILTLSFLSICLYGQENKEIDLVGLIQSEDGEPLMFATIASYNGDKVVSASTTNITGIFELIAKGDQIEVRYLGYESFRKSVNYFLENPVITMKEEVNYLNEVVVYANRCKNGCCRTGPCSGITHRRQPAPINLNIGLNSTQWQAYPNPTLSSITIKTVFDTGVFRLLSATGQTLGIIPIYDFTSEINLDTYPAGSYYLRYESQYWREIFGPIVKVKD